MTIEQFQAAVAAATTGEQLDVLESQMIAIGHAHDAPLRVSVEQRRRALGVTQGQAARDAHVAHLTARAAMAERLAKDPQLPGADEAKRQGGEVAKRHAEATAIAKDHYREAAKSARATLEG